MSGAIHLAVSKPSFAKDESNGKSPIETNANIENLTLFLMNPERGLEHELVEEPVEEPEGLVEEPVEEPTQQLLEKANDPKYETDSPEIFFHAKKPITTDVTITIPDGVTLTIPEVPMSNQAIWEDVHITDDNMVVYGNEEYPYLYYEGRFSYPLSNYGWLVEQMDGKLWWNGKLIDKEEFLEFLREKFSLSGLYENEVEVLINRILDYDMLEFSGRYLAIRYIPIKDVDQTMTLETSKPFVVLRRHFWIEELDEPMDMQEPLFEYSVESDFIIHETAVNRG